MMNLNINSPPTLTARYVSEVKNIPCICRVRRGGDFKVTFSSPLFDSFGFISGWSNKSIDDRFPALGGGSVAQHCHAMISIEKIDEKNYLVADLKFFHDMEGWIPIVENGELVPIERKNYEGY